MSTVGSGTHAKTSRSSSLVGTLKRFFKPSNRSEEVVRVCGTSLPGVTPSKSPHCRDSVTERSSIDIPTTQALDGREAVVSSFSSRKSVDRHLFASNSGPLLSKIHRIIAQAPLHHSVSDTCEAPSVQVNLQRQLTRDASWLIEPYKQLQGQQGHGVRSSPLKYTTRSDASLPSLGEGPSRSSSLDIPNAASSSLPALGGNHKARLAVPVSLPSVEPTPLGRMPDSQGAQNPEYSETSPPEQPVPPPTTTLLAMCPGVPAAMRRRHWCLEDFEVVRRIYKGSTSAVYKGICRRTGLQVALKVYSLSRVPANVVHMIVREIKIHVELVHKHIAMLYGAFQDEKRLVLVQEYAGRGDLYGIYRSLNRRMTEPQLTHLVLAPFLDALSFLHARGICHRDIKPENILFTHDWRLLLADFGVSIDLNQERAVTRAGTLEYMAPEVERCPLKMLPEENKENMDLAYTTAVDIWATGVLSYELLVGFPPFVVDNAAAASSGGGGGNFLAEHANRSTLSFPSSTSLQARDFISLALAERAEERPTALQLVRHPWLASAMHQSPQCRSSGQLSSFCTATPLYPSRLGSSSMASAPNSCAVPASALVQ